MRRGVSSLSSSTRTRLLMAISSCRSDRSVTEGLRRSPTRGASGSESPEEGYDLTDRPIDDQLRQEADRQDGSNERRGPAGGQAGDQHDGGRDDHRAQKVRPRKAVRSAMAAPVPHPRDGNGLAAGDGRGRSGRSKGSGQREVPYDRDGYADRGCQTDV